MDTVFTIQVTPSSKQWYNNSSLAGMGAPGGWRIRKGIGVINGGFDWPTTIATHENPNGWNVTPNDGANPTELTIRTTLDIGELDLVRSVTQSSLDSSSSPGPNTYVNENITPSTYFIEIFSTVTESVTIGGVTSPGGNTYYRKFGVESFGPQARIEEIDTEFYSGEGSYSGRRQIVDYQYTLTQSAASISSLMWELWTTDGVSQPVNLIQGGDGELFRINDELEPGDRYLLRLTVNNSFGKSGYIFIYIQGKSLAAHYDRTSGAIRILYGPNILRCATYYTAKKPVLDLNHPSTGVISALQIFRYGARVFVVTTTGIWAVSLTEGLTWQGYIPPQYLTGQWSLYGNTVTPDGSVYNQVFRLRSGSQIFFAQSGDRVARGTVGLEGFKRPALMLNIGNGYILIAKLANDVVCASSQDGITWTGGGVVSPDSRLIGAFKTADHSIVSVMVIPRGGSPQLVRLFNTDDGWDIHDATNVTGLPETLRTPAAVDSDGIRTVLVYTDGDGHGMATSDDLGLTWEVAEG